MNSPLPTGRTCLGVVLAAGDGVRMRSAKPKALHEVAGRPMIAHALAALGGAEATAFAVVVGPHCDDVAAAARAFSPGRKSSFSTSGAARRTRRWPPARQSRAASTTCWSSMPIRRC